MNIAYFLLGCITLRVGRAYAERVLNLCMHHGIVYLNGGSDTDCLCLCLRTGQAKRLCVLMQGEDVPYTVVKRAGIPQLFCRLLARILATPLSLDAIYEDSLTP